MAIYEFENKQGEKRSIVASMKNNPPMAVIFTSATEWIPAEDDGPNVWQRVIRLAGAKVSRGAAIDHGSHRLPTSMTMPRTNEQGEVVNRFGQQVRKLKNGHYADMQGRRIVDSHAAREAHAKETGMVVSND